ncbi:MAG TPA: TetR/AcrR family transcriptional regulator [Acidimicrobiales bacterium]|nr:TetR/AcrR family transcriptional regulator [Acidimicrobiales bacterium]
MTPSSTEAVGGAGEGGERTDLPLPDLLPLEFAVAEFCDETTGDTPAIDGRVARGQRTRRNVAQALIDLLREGDCEPTAKSVAERAGVSLRLVFHHFAEMDDLYHYVAAIVLRRQWSGMPRISANLALATRVERTVAHRAALYEEIAPVRRALVRRGAAAPSVSDAIGASDGLLLENLKETFAPELEAMPSTLRGEHLEALDTASSWEAWDRLRTVSRLQVRGAKRVMTRTIEALCAASDSASNSMRVASAVS